MKLAQIIEIISQILFHLKDYTIEILPSLFIGFLLSGIVHEFLPQSIAEKYLNKKGVLPIFYVTIIGIILPVCCLGSLPIAVTFRKKGMPLGPILAFLVATPATSISSILVTLSFLGIWFTIYLCTTVILMGLIIGLIGNLLPYQKIEKVSEHCPMCEEGDHKKHFHHSKKNISQRIVSVLSYGFIDLPKEMGLEIILGIILAAIISSISPIKYLIKNYLSGWFGYVFALVFGLLMYICATASVPLVDAFINQGMNKGAGLILLIAGPVTSYGTILVLKKEFGLKILLFYIATISIISLISGFIYSLIM